MNNPFDILFYKKDLEKQTKYAGCIFFTFALSLLAVFQDFLQSTDRQTGFYFSESLLFRSFWMLVLPVVFLQARLLEKYGKAKSALLLSVTLATLIHLLAFAALVNTVSALLFDHTYTFGRVFYYSLTEDLYKGILVYGTVAGIYSYRPAQVMATPVQQASTITIQNGRKYFSLAIQDIRYIQSSSPYISIFTAQKQYLHATSLKAILSELDGQQFVRIHKSTIVNLNEVIGFQSRLNGDYDLELKDGTQLRLSRNYVAVFRKHIGLS